MLGPFQRGLESFRIGVDNCIEENEEGKEGDAGGIEQYSLIEYRRHLAVEGNEGRCGGEDAIYFEEGDGFGAALRHDESVLEVARKSQGQDDVKFDRSDEEELGHLLSAVDGEDDMSHFGKEGPEVATGLVVKGSGALMSARFQSFGAAWRATFSDSIDSTSTGQPHGRCRPAMLEMALARICSGRNARGGGGCFRGGSLAHGRICGDQQQRDCGGGQERDDGVGSPHGFSQRDYRWLFMVPSKLMRHRWVCRLFAGLQVYG